MSYMTVFARVAFADLFVRLLGLGLPGSWLAAFTDQFVRSLLIGFRYKTGRWKHIEV